MDKICPECGESFIPIVSFQIYCSDKCKWRVSKRNLRKRRISNNRCPQCGREMQSTKGTYKEKISYCNECAEYFHQKYIQNKGVLNNV